MENLMPTLDNERRVIKLSLNQQKGENELSFPAYYDKQDGTFITSFLHYASNPKLAKLIKTNLAELAEGLTQFVSTLPGPPKLCCLCPAKLQEAFIKNGYCLYGKPDDFFMIRPPQNLQERPTPEDIKIVDDKPTLHLKAEEIDKLVTKNAYWLEKEMKEGIEARINAAHICLAAIDNKGKVVGFVRAISDGDSWYISDMVVAEELRNKKIGSFLLQELLKKLPYEKEWVYLHAADLGPGVEAARKLYAKFGFQFNESGSLPVILLGKSNAELKEKRKSLFSSSAEQKETPSHSHYFRS